MTGEQQHRHLLTLVTDLARRASWPELWSPVTAARIKGEAQWRDELRSAGERRTMTCVGALHALADELYERLKSGSPSPSLATRSAPLRDHVTYDEPRLPAFRHDFEVFCRAVLAAKRHGLTVRTDLVEFIWFDRAFADSNEAPGCFDSMDRDHLKIHLLRGQSELELFRTVVHELQHAHDYLTLGQASYHALGRAEQERRADAAEVQVSWAEGFLVTL